MNKYISTILAVAILISFSFTNSSLAQNIVLNEDSGVQIEKEKSELTIELKNLRLIEFDLGKRLSELKAENEARNQEHNTLKPAFTEYAQRKRPYDQKCSGQTIHLDNEREKQIKIECDEEKIWLESTRESLRERKDKIDKRDEQYRKDLAQLKLDSDAWQAKMEVWSAKNNAWQAKRNAVIEKVAQDVILAFKDQGLRDWRVKNVKFEIRGDTRQEHLLSPWMGDNKLVFTEEFLTETPAMQENLIAFETGKLFFHIMKDKPVKDGRTLEMWFMKYALEHNSVIENMRAAKHLNEGFPDTWIVDPVMEWYSGFGYIVRAQVLQLDKPKGKRAQEEWDEAIHEFRTHIDPLLRGR